MSDDRARMSSVLGATGLVLGNVQGQGDFEVRGRVQGDIVLEGRVLIATGGLVLGTIEAVQITVSGTVRGDLIAEDGVEISGSGQVEGNVTSPRVSIEAGAKVRGHLRTGEEPPAAIRGGKDLLAIGERAIAERLPLDDDASIDELPSDALRADALRIDALRTGDPEGLALPVVTLAPKYPLSAPTDGPEGRGPSGKKRRRRRRGGDRAGGTAEANGPPTDSAGTNSTHVDEGLQARLPPQRPTRPSGPILPPEKSSQGLPPSDGTPPAGRRSKPLPTFVKGARGHLRS